MNVFFNPNVDITHKIRNEKNLEKQIKQDYGEIKELWERVEKGTSDISETEKIMERIAWVNSGIEALKRSMDGNIEGICLAEMDKIKGDVKSIQRKMRIRIKKFYKKENSHLR